jgi:hypothetical protein
MYNVFNPRPAAPVLTVGSGLDPGSATLSWATVSGVDRVGAPLDDAAGAAPRNGGRSGTDRR